MRTNEAKEATPVETEQSTSGQPLLRSIPREESPREDRPLNTVEEEAVCREKPYPINIDPLNYGYVVRVGCQSFAIEDSTTLVKYLAAYLADPEKCQSNWMKSKKLPSI